MAHNSSKVAEQAGEIALLQPEAPTMHVSSGRLEYYPKFKSRHIKARDVNVWLPDGYEPGDPCAVIYMHDGQMLFDAATTWNHQEWQVDEVMGRLIAEQAIRPCIVVGVDNGEADRFNEYFPQKTLDYLSDEAKAGVDVSPFNADDYLSFLVKELKPFIDKRYRPLTDAANTFVLGSSMGGLISLYALCEYPQVFGGAACMSTHVSMFVPGVQIDNKPWATAFRQYVVDHMPEANSHLIYMDRGDQELDDTYRLYQNLMNVLFTSRGWDDDHFVSRVFEGHFHMETYWAERLDQPLTFLLAR